MTAAAAAAEDAAGDECDEYHLEHPDVVAVLKFVAEIFPNEETRHYVLKWLASQFSGHVKDELFHVLIGTGANGKSKLQELMSYTLGSLYATTTIKTFTGQRAEANATNSNYLHIKNKRGVFVQEPGPDESINGGIMKELTGGDKISFRPLYSECQEFRPQATFALVSNYKPKVPAEDMALWRRIRCVRFEREFKANPDPENPLHCQRDDNLASKLPGWAPAFQWYLLTQYYPLYVKEGILRDEQIPPAVYRETEQYRAANDEIVDFVSANIDRVTDAPPPSPVAGAAEAEDEDDIAAARRGGGHGRALRALHALRREPAAAQRAHPRGRQRRPRGRALREAQALEEAGEPWRGEGGLATVGLEDAGCEHAHQLVVVVAQQQKKTRTHAHRERCCVWGGAKARRNGEVATNLSGFFPCRGK